ncbi:methyl-accepting chemotaxis protein [Desulfosediminicola flagellatus]|uniref:methyl-accepting chemotaxis protein n=1 Tax=Desulfosediminicola flagellatus TaxID=2569541 RepID=UPI00142ED785|nr:methyl-accepting chemotaxis protein [Desulfosediminicola flagellatus]
MSISSKEISNIIKVIDEIAFQTNLLAYNAAVESGRAGVHGKGFAVVAEEVRNLAARSAKVGEINSALEEILDLTSSAGRLVAEMSVASGEQSSGLAQIREGLAQIDKAIQQHSASAEQTASAMAEISVKARGLQATFLSRFRLNSALETHGPGQHYLAEIASGYGHQQQPRPDSGKKKGGWSSMR